ncbi:ABC transporter substrate-binding protein [Geodermatophilus sp. DSM 44513]|uniref:ABC transporter substrate-binding protein n=1 Tax=Geodermatophilus sp. DSM 44513 TaxID=1528104 RepID=UPI001282E4EB|nr:ABC transporter substrate-binding protein [Geodermatophilus sp. DSM 44513]WNV74088.1 ABC transporter substrate-binding protein [Geodermatophilus sp. DSM 44513]
MRPTPRPRTLGTVLALTAAVTLTACNSAAPSASGSGGGGGDGGPVTIGVGGQPLLAYLPTTLADQVGCYADAGVDVEIQDLGSGSKALQAMIGGSTDVTSGYYDHTVQMAAKNQQVTAFVNMLRYPALVVAVAPDAAGEIDSIEDLEGKAVGVTAPGSSTDFFLKHLLTQAGLPADAASVQAIGADATAVAAMEQGQVDAAVLLDPSIAVLESRVGELTLLADTRTVAGVEEAYGTDTYPAAVLYATQDYIDANAETVGQLADGITCALEYIQSHSGAEIAAEMPPQLVGEDPALYADAVEALKEAYNPTGEIDQAGAEAVRDVLAGSQPEIADADVDVSTTYTNEFVQP